MKSFVLLLVLSINHQNHCEIKRLRQLHYQAVENEEKIGEMVDFINKCNSIDKSLKTGYFGMSYMLKARHAWNPYSKYEYFKKGRSMIDNAIKQQQDKIELRYLRLSIQFSLPGFLEYNNDIENDKLYIINNMNNLMDSDLKRRINKLLLEINHCPNIASN